MPKNHDLRCKLAMMMVRKGVWDSRSIRQLVRTGDLTKECGLKAIREIRDKVSMNGRKRRRR